MDVYNRVEKELEQFEFLQYLETPSYWDEKSKKAIILSLLKCYIIKKHLEECMKILK